MKTETNPIQSLQHIAATVPDPVLGEWLSEGIRHHLNTGESLDSALGLSGSLGRSARFRWLREKRNEYLRDALDHLDGDFEALAEEISRYYRSPLCFREREQPDSSWSVIRCSIHQAARLGIHLPETRQGLASALR